ncbi:JAB-like toxin 1 domain-containing protein [Tenacibaculum maritimum]|uniref:JAB-like toxin 1 domain-containing protein n=1 Tax=Tenacibaculum maritimum TaxID=107401 RepID=UPI0010A44A27|nr:JAB-like toxin 1 domain-containing protein [Tenacibaculum maritimum]QCD61907.1 hypothetical protein B9C57_04805 [Tenacibaculum maritimum]
MNLDPLADDMEQIDKSPYASFWNNPVRYVDPTGLKPEDDYWIDKYGKITLLRKTNEKVDRLYAVTTDKEGNKTVDKSKVSVTVSKNKDGSSIVSNLADSYTETKYLDSDDIERTSRKSSTRTHEGKKNEVFSVFKFVAENSNVEWSVNKYEIMPNSPDYEIGTYHRGDLSPGFNGLGDWKGMIHSHPNEPTAKGRTESLYGDLSVGANYLAKYGKKLPYLVYFPQTKRVAKMRVGKTVTGKVAAKKPIRGLKNIKF